MVDPRRLPGRGDLGFGPHWRKPIRLLVNRKEPRQRSAAAFRLCCLPPEPSSLEAYAFSHGIYRVGMRDPAKKERTMGRTRDNARAADTHLHMTALYAGRLVANG